MVSSFQRQIGSDVFNLETGRLALQANGSVLVRHGDTVVLVTATMSRPREGIDFFPLTVDFEERMYAKGKIPNIYFRREGRPSTEATLTARLTDRPIRPLFPKDFRNEVQIIITALSTDMERPLDIVAMVGASTALSISDIPFNGPIGACRVGYVNGEFVVNPTYQQMEESELDLIVAGSRNGVIMIEAGSYEFPEDLMLQAVEIAQKANLEAITLQEEMAAAVGKAKSSYTPFGPTPELERLVAEKVGTRIADAFVRGTTKAERNTAMDSIKQELLEQFQDEYEPKSISGAFEAYTEKEFRKRVLEHGERPDGRGVKEIRPISADVSLLPRTHGSSLFQRGETQVLGITTLGSVGDAQRVDDLFHPPDSTKRFMLHYNFPPYSTGEVKRIGSPGRREIGHGALAERAIEPVLPNEDEFPYVIRVVAECLGSNGSTSMASTCAGTLALMDAGVPIKSPVAGISIGLITGEDGKFTTLTDIQGMEDHYGDMDFKVAGTAHGITAIQLDIKSQYITLAVVEAALSQAKEARDSLLGIMKKAIEAPRSDISEFAPRMTRIKIPVEKIGLVIGPGGKMIRAIIEETKATVDIEDDGTVTIGSTDRLAAKRAVEIIEGLTREAKVGDIYTGKVVRTTNFGAFVEIFPGQDGMVHISELADYRVGAVEDIVKVGDDVTVQVINVDPSGKIALSRRALLEGDGAKAQGEAAGDGAEAGHGSGYKPRPQGGGGQGGGGRRDDRRGPPRSGGGGRPGGFGGRR
ncbi:MAG: polyribonucleotide nucleotidyltransferase [SAR202 cluster bacterium]|nr:polyribonucleotide nucleotidyltransferase [SAR202 cluster bacterium]